eukprot:m.156346 g.156346  ORF g.156346 m.156346 type:complete len:1170 (-) comp13338_c0_seq2:3066-6575(-)
MDLCVVLVVSVLAFLWGVDVVVVVVVASGVEVCEPTPECEFVAFVPGSSPSHNCDCVGTLSILVDATVEARDEWHVGENASITQNLQISFLGAVNFENSTLVVEIGSVVGGSVLVDMDVLARLGGLHIIGLVHVEDVLDMDINGHLGFFTLHAGCNKFLSIDDFVHFNGEGRVEEVHLPFVERIGRNGLSNGVHSIDILLEVGSFYLNSPQYRLEHCGNDPIQCGRSRLQLFGVLHLVCRTVCNFHLSEVEMLLANDYHNITSAPGSNMTFWLGGYRNFFMFASPFHFSGGGDAAFTINRIGEIQTVDNPNYPQNIFDLDPRYPNTTVTLTFQPLATVIKVTESATASSCNGQGVLRNDGSNECECFLVINSHRCESFPPFTQLPLYLFDLTEGKAYRIDTLVRYELDNTGWHYVFFGFNFILTNVQDARRLTAWQASYINDENTQATTIGMSARSFQIDQIPLRIVIQDPTPFKTLLTIHDDHIYHLQAAPAFVCIGLEVEESFNGLGEVLANATRFGTYSEEPFYQGEPFSDVTTAFTYNFTTKDTKKGTPTQPQTSTAATTVTSTFFDVTLASNNSTPTTPATSTTLIDEQEDRNALNSSLIILIALASVVVLLIVVVVVVTSKRRHNNSTPIEEQKSPEVVVLQSFSNNDDGFLSKRAKPSLSPASSSSSFSTLSAPTKSSSGKPTQSSRSGQLVVPTINDFVRALVQDNSTDLQLKYDLLYDSDHHDKSGSNKHQDPPPQLPPPSTATSQSVAISSSSFSNNPPSSTENGNVSSFLLEMTAPSTNIDGDDSCKPPSEARERFMDMRLEDNNTLLMKAVALNAVECIPMLSKLGPRFDVTNYRRENILHVVCGEDVHVDTRVLVLHVVLSNGHAWECVDVNGFDIDGFTPLMKAVRLNYEDVVSVLLVHGADPLIGAQQVDVDGVDGIDGIDGTDVRSSSTTGVKNIVRIAAKPMTSPATISLQSSVVTAMVYHRSMLLHLMLQSSMCPDHLTSFLDEQGRTLLHIATELNAHSCVAPLLRADRRQLFIKGGANGTTPFHDAIRLNYPLVVKAIIGSVTSTIFKRILLLEDNQGVRSITLVTHKEVGDLTQLNSIGKEHAIAACFSTIAIPPTEASQVVVKKYWELFGKNKVNSAPLPRPLVGDREKSSLPQLHLIHEGASDSLV